MLSFQKRKRINELADRLGNLQSGISTFAKEFNESDHPRDNDGKFTSGGGGSSGTSSDSSSSSSKEEEGGDKGSSTFWKWADRLATIGFYASLAIPGVAGVRAGAFIGRAILQSAIKIPAGTSVYAAAGAVRAAQTARTVEAVTSAVKSAIGTVAKKLNLKALAAWEVLSMITGKMVEKRKEEISKADQKDEILHRLLNFQAALKQNKPGKDD